MTDALPFSTGQPGFGDRGLLAAIDAYPHYLRRREIVAAMHRGVRYPASWSREVMREMRRLGALEYCPRRRRWRAGPRAFAAFRRHARLPWTVCLYEEHCRRFGVPKLAPGIIVMNARGGQA